MTAVAFIGLGNMGGPMAANLARAGHEVIGFDVVDRQIEGVSIAETAAQAAERAEVVITSLPNGALVAQVVDELLAADSSPRLLIDVSTIAVAEARELAQRVAVAGSSFLDAPVSGLSLIHI